jgi:hypothetical protein
MTLIICIIILVIVGWSIPIKSSKLSFNLHQKLNEKLINRELRNIILELGTIPQLIEFDRLVTILESFDYSMIDVSDDQIENFNQHFQNESKKLKRMIHRSRPKIYDAFEKYNWFNDHYVTTLNFEK